MTLDSAQKDKGESESATGAIKVTCAQIAPVVGNVTSNRRLVREAVRESVSAGADLIVLPELCTSGYVFESVDEARAMSQPADGGALQDWAEEAARSDAVVVGGFCELGEDSLLYNSAAVVDATGTLAVYRKIHLWDREKLFFEPGRLPAPVVKTRVGSVGVAICHDMWFPEVTRQLASRGADIITLPTNCPRFPRPEGERPMEITLPMALAHLYRIFFATCDRCGTERGFDWVGGSVVVDQNGWLLAGPPPDYGPGLVSATCHLHLAHDKAWNDRNHIFRDRRPDLYGGAHLRSDD